MKRTSAKERDCPNSTRRVNDSSTSAESLWGGFMKQTQMSYGTIDDLQQAVRTDLPSPANSDVSRVFSRLRSLACMIILPARVAGVAHSSVSGSSVIIPVLKLRQVIIL